MTDDVPQQPTDREPAGAATLCILARVMIHYASFTGSPLARWRASAMSTRPSRTPVELADLGSDPSNTSLGN
ncbi:hypothetical protein E4K10_46165 [Streptomyces sp. T1317-0309]|nr:hypothetical protein E4K10_46165 [Streptomyces sp. T1317-0309]